MTIRSLDLFPREVKADSGLPIQGRILIRNSQFLMTPTDVLSLVAQGELKATDDPDQSQSIGSRGL